MTPHIRQTILRWLTRRDYSQHEIVQKLKAKGYSPDAIEPVVLDLTQSGLLNEARFTENYIHYRRAKGYGPRRISNELQTRGIASEMIAERLQITDNAWFTEARKVWQKYFKGKLPTDFKQAARQIRFLQYRGFTQEHIDSIMKDTYGNEE